MRVRAFVFMAVFLLSVYALTFSSSYTSSNVGEGDKKITALNVLFQFGYAGLDPIYQGTGGSGGYTWHEFGQNFFVLPFFILLKPLQTTGYPFFFADALLTVLTAILLLKILMAIGYSRAAACLTSLVYGLGTFAWFYAAKGAFKQPAAAFLLLGEFYYMLKYVLNKPRKKRYLFAAAVFLGFGIVTKTDLALSVIPLAVLLWNGLGGKPENRKALLKTAAAFFIILIPFAAFYMYYDYVRFGSVFKNGYYYSSDIRLKYLPMGVSGFLFSPGKSVFLYCPVLLITIFSLKDFLRKAPRFLYTAAGAAVLMYFIIYSAWIDWHGDVCWGPRYLLLVMPFLIMPVASLFENWGALSRWTKAAALAVLIVSVSVQVLPAVSNFYLGIEMKYGCGTLARDWAQVGPEGSVTNWKSFFRVRESAIFNQVGILYDTLNILLHKPNTLSVMLGLKSRWPSATFSCVFNNFDFYTPDLWWVQAGTLRAYFWAFMVLELALFSLYGLIREIKRPQIQH